MTTRKRLGIAVVGFGWMGQAHSRGYRRVSQIFGDAGYETDLVVCADEAEVRRHQAQSGFGFTHTTDDWRAAIDRPDVDVVSICAPNMVHEEIAVAAAALDKHVFCEKPVGGKPEQTVRVEKATRAAGVITGVGYNYRWAPLIQYTKQLLDRGELGQIQNYRGEFLCSYGADPLCLLSWRFLQDQAGYGVSSDILSHSVDLSHMLVGPIKKVFGTTETFIKERPVPQGVGTHYDRGRPGDPTAEVTNEDYVGAMVVFENGARGTFEVSRTMVGPESHNAFDIHGTRGAAHWDLEKMNEMDLFLEDPGRPRGYRRVLAGEVFPYHGNFVVGIGNGLAYEDLVTIEDHEYLSAVAEGRPFAPGFSEAVDYVSVQAAVLKSAASGRWEDVVSLRED